MKILFPFLLALLAAAVLPAQEGHHVHAAPHGGTLVEVGRHQFNLELVRDAEAGTLTVYVLGAHAEDFVRLPAKALELTVEVKGRTERLALGAVANELSGETVGDTSQFTAQADWLKRDGEFKGRFAALEIRGVVFRDVAFTFPVNADHDGD
ncbi:hypothetical protein [Oleiharenicola sp. Vm1]|uniref:hypothetical protein n=1 Tax=Oleiharenicola sp. Vm1 TaxID=3398393 RepID=UPI0039F47B6C